MTAFVYRLPDGSDDKPDERGQHTKTINVLHSAAQYERFPGCAECRSCAEHDRWAQDVAGYYPSDGRPNWYTVAGIPDQTFASMSDAVDAWYALRGETR